MSPGLLLAPADLPALPRHAARSDRAALRHLPWARAACADARRWRSRFRRAWTTAIASGSRAKGEAGRNGGPPGDLYVEIRVAAARDLRARRRRPVLRSAGEFCHRGAGRHGRGADAGWPGDAEDSGRDPVRPRVPAARQGRQARCAAAVRRSVLPGRGRDAGEPHRRAEGPAAKTSTRRCRRAATAISPREQFLARRREAFFEKMAS